MNLQVKRIVILLFASLLLSTSILASSCIGKDVAAQNTQALNKLNGEILIGVEYAMPGMAKAYAAMGIPAVKYYPEEICWEKIQPAKNSPLDFSRMDRFVREYQDAGFRELMLALKSRSKWASKNIITNHSPRPEYLAAYETWINRVVERYDMDGKDDMPGLKAPVRYIEIGSEFSSYEPEPAADYITMLERAYRGAHTASNNIIVMHAAFLATTAFKNHPKPDQYTASFNAADKRVMFHSLAEIRKILDRPDIFDALNFHALSDPYEIEDTVGWLNYEMGLRKYKKPVVISDTSTSPFIGYGPATVYKGPQSQLGILSPPAAEKDRPRLAAYFQKLIDGDGNTIAWVHSHAASDMVKKVIVAADQDIVFINTAFMEEFEPFKSKLFKASAGNAGWGGITLTTVNMFNQERTIKEYRPAFYAIQQLAAHMQGCSSIERVPAADNRIRVYKLIKNNKPFWVAWFEPDTLILPKDPVPQAKFQFKESGGNVVIEQMINRQGQTVPDRSTVQVKNGAAEITLTPAPVYILSGS